MEQKIKNQPWQIDGEVGLDVNKLLKLYDLSLKAGGTEFAGRVTAEAIASESTVVLNTAAESTAFLTASAIAEISKTRKK